MSMPGASTPGECLDCCTICAVKLFGYEDGRCVMCGNCLICSDCVQVCDRQSLESATLWPNRFFWDQRSQSFDKSPVRPGDLVCLQCGIYSALSMDRARWVAGFDMACEAIDALLPSPRRRMGQSFMIWKAFCRGQREHASRVQFGGGAGDRSWGQGPPEFAPPDQIQKRPCDLGVAVSSPR